MASTVLLAKTGRETGSASSRRLRRENQIPGVLYGHGMDPISISVDRRELRLAVSGPAGFNTVLDLTVESDAGSKVYPAIVKVLQRHPVKRNVAHIDFQQVNLDESITVSVPVRLEGEAAAVVQGGGLVDPAVDTIDVVTTPRLIPDEFVIDITDLQMDSIIRLSDVPMPEGVVPAGDPDMPVVTILVTRATAEDEADAAAIEAAGEGEGGDAAAADDSAAE